MLVPLQTHCWAAFSESSIAASPAAGGAEQHEVLMSVVCWGAPQVSCLWVYCCEGQLRAGSMKQHILVTCG